MLYSLSLCHTQDIFRTDNSQTAPQVFCTDFFPVFQSGRQLLFLKKIHNVLVYRCISLTQVDCLFYNFISQFVSHILMNGLQGFLTSHHEDVVNLFRTTDFCQGLNYFQGVLMEFVVASALIPLLRPSAHLDMILHIALNHLLRT